MIDVHTHILPGLDDGAETVEESIRMARVAAADGVEVMVATPHVGGDFDWQSELLEGRLARLREALLAADVGLQVVLGCEAMLRPDLAVRAREGAYPTLAGSRYLLVEWPLQQYPTYVDQALFDLRLKGFVPVLAHAERYLAIQADVDRLVSLVERGILAQVTAGSLLGAFGPAAERTARIALEHGLAHVLASDAHSATRRPPMLSRGVAEAARIVGAEAARAMVVDTPRAVVENRPVEPPPPRPYRRRPLWAFWRRADRESAGR